MKLLSLNIKPTGQLWYDNLAYMTKYFNLHYDRIKICGYNSTSDDRVLPYAKKVPSDFLESVTSFPHINEYWVKNSHLFSVNAIECYEKTAFNFLGNFQFYRRFYTNDSNVFYHHKPFVLSENQLISFKKQFFFSLYKDDSYAQHNLDIGSTGNLKEFTESLQAFLQNFEIYKKFELLFLSYIKQENYQFDGYYQSYILSENGHYFDFLSSLNYYSLFYENYLGILIFLSIASLLSSIIIIASYSLNTQYPETEKLSSYECGFELYENARHIFDVKFCLIAILFILLDIEVIYLFPWSVGLSKLSGLGFWVMVEFLVELSVGFIYIWLTSSLEWS